MNICPRLKNLNNKMKLTTIILETLAYLAQVFSIVFLFMSITAHNILVGVLTSAVLWVIGFALYRWELYIENRRTEPSEHYDFIVLITLGWLMLSLIVVYFATPNLKTDIEYPIVHMIVSNYLIGAGLLRRRMYNKKAAQNNKE